MVDQRRIDDQRWVDSRTAAKHLGIQQRTLYAYVSRGQVRSVPGSNGRPRLYALADLERLRVRRDARAGHGAVAAGALRWGEPVLDSAITAITPEGPAYRGHLAVSLAMADVPFENVAELLWSGVPPTDRVRWPRSALPVSQLARLVPHGARPLDAMALVVDVAALADPQRDASRLDGPPGALIARGRSLIPLLAAALAPELSAAVVTRATTASSVAAVAARALGLDDAAAPMLDRVLVLLADHELNASSFAARVAASTGADPYACIAAALATVSGPLHGSASEAIARFADGVGGPDGVRSALTALRRSGSVPPGFGHPLYPAGDPRARPLIAMARELAESSRVPGVRRARTLLAIVDELPSRQRGPSGADQRLVQPSVDVGLAALVAALGAPPSAGPGLFALARSAGWLAHVLEQRAAGFLLRPRARYVGPQMGSDPNSSLPTTWRRRP